MKCSKCERPWGQVKKYAKGKCKSCYNSAYKPSQWEFKDPHVERRFWSHASIQGPDDCWDWKLSLNDKGYGRIMIRGRSWQANRAAWAITHKKDPGKMLVCHDLLYLWIAVT